MAISFRRTPDVKLNNYDVTKKGLVYPGLIINVRSEDGLVLGSESKLTRYETGQYAPFLQKVTVNVDGELGLLLRAEYTFVVETDADFTKYNRAFLASGKLVTIEYGWASPHPGYATNKQGLWKNLAIYDYSWEYDSTSQRYICTAKAMGQAGTIEDCEFAVGLPNAKNLKIIKETYSADNNRRPVEYAVNSVTDLIIYDAQADKILYDGKTSVDVDVKAVGGGHIVIINMLDSNWFSRLLAKILPSGFIKPSKTPKVYVSLNYLINRVLNEQVVDYHFKAAVYNGTFRPTYKVSDETSIEGLGLLFSPDPGSVAFPGGTSGTYLTEDGLYGVDFNQAIGLNGYEGCIQGNKLKLGNILISLDALRTIDRELEKGRDEKKKADKTDDSNKPEIVMPIKDFISKIGALINNNSGGLIDLTTYQDEDENKAGRPVINIVDRNFKGTSIQTPTPLEFNNRYPGDGVTLSANITSEIPKDAVALNMYATNIKGTTARKISERAQRKEVERKVYYDNAISYLPEIRTSELPGSEFDEDSVQSATRMIRKYVQNRPLEIVERTNNAPFNLKLKIQIAGVEGFKFGDLITLKGLPPEYKNGVCFRIIRYKHIFEANRWITELETVCDLL